MAEALAKQSVEERYRFFAAMLRPLGIAKGKPFQPDDRQKKILPKRRASGEAMAKARTFDKRSKGTTTFQYTYGAKNEKQISPDNWTFDQIFLDRPGNDAIQLDLLYDYNSNLALYDGWHEYFRTSQPRTLILWGKNDPFFTVEGAKAYQRDLPKAELHLLDTGHFALEEEGDVITERIKQFLS